jgi:glycosyltransferase involved in cell wall biosynthesis
MIASTENSRSAALSDKHSRTLWLSILLPVYNVAEFLRPCVESIMAQNPDKGVEIILLDDCSADNSRAIGEQLCTEFPEHVSLISHAKNSGLSAARNSLLNAARGEYIWFVDSDDYLLPGALKSLHNIVENHSPDIILCDYRKRRFLRRKSFPGYGKKLERSIRDLVHGVFTSRKMYSWLKISRRRLWGDDLRFPKGRAFEDMATTPHLMLRAESYYYEPSAWLHYRVRRGSIMDGVRATKAGFDTAKHKDLSEVMCGFKEQMHAKLASNDQPINFVVSNFVAVEFAKLAARYNKGMRANPAAISEYPPLSSYYDSMQQCAPYTFEELQFEYLKRLSVIRYFNLRRAIRLTKYYDKAGQKPK